MSSIDEDWRKHDSGESSTQQSFQAEVVTDEEFSCIIPSSPNWYCNNNLTCLNGYAAFGGKNALFILNMKKNPPICEWSLSGTSFSSRITATSLICCGDANDAVDHIAFGCEDGLLKIANVENKSIIKDLNKHKVKITALGWSTQTRETLVSGDEKGVILVWDFIGKTCNVWTPLTSTITCLVLSPHTANVGVFGYLNGNIIVGDTKKCAAIHIFKNNTNEVYSLSWNPSKIGQDVFVSGSKDKTIRLFNYLEENNVKTFHLPRNISSSNKSNNKNTYQGKTFFSVLWLNEKQIVSSYFNGELLVWEISNGKWKVMTHEHNRVIFTMCKDTLTNYFVSISMDRMIILHNSETLKASHKIPSFGGFVYSLSNTPHDPHCLAVGVGDNTIRVWNTGNRNKPYTSTSIWNGIKTKVTIIEYHPIKEGIIGYGTDDGHVGCYSSISQKSDVSVTYHKRTVYALSWGPSCQHDDSEESKIRINCLYSIGGEGSLLMHKMGTFNQPAVDVGNLIKERNNLSTIPLRSEIKWHHSYEYVAIGNEDGTIDIFQTTKLVLMCKIQVHKKMINSLDWHHNFGADSGNYEYWLACGSNEETVNVLDINMARQHEITETSSPLIIDNPFQQLIGHNGRITKVAWSPHTNGVLASSSYDGSVQVWDVKKNEFLGNYRGHIGRVHCVTWSFTNSDVLFSGGEDFCLHRWKYTETKDKTPPTQVKKPKSRGKKKKKEKTEQGKNEVEESSPDVIESQEPVSPAPIADGIASAVVQPLIATETVSHSQYPEVKFLEKIELDKKKKRGTKGALFKKSSVADSKKKELMQQDCIDLAVYLKGDPMSIVPGSEEHVNLGLYADRKDAFRLLSTECEGHLENGHTENFDILQIWQNNLPAAIEHAIQKKTLNESLIALSPLCGYDVWRSACLAYGEQLEEKNSLHSAASYYVSFGDARRAIKMFYSNNMFKEAIVLGKAQLPKNDPLLKELYEQWAKKLSSESSYEHAAKCFLACGHIEEAITMLCKRNDANAFLTAIKVASTYEMIEKADEFAIKAIKCLLNERRWLLCYDLLVKSKHASKVLPIQLVVGELLVDFLNKNGLFMSENENTDGYKWCTNIKRSYPSYLQLPSGSLDVSFIYSVLDVLEKCFGISLMQPVSIEEIPTTQLLQNHRNSTDVLRDVVIVLVYGFIGLLNKNLPFAFKHFLRAFDVLSINGHQHVLESLYVLLFPHCTITFDNLLKNFSDSPSSEIRTLQSNFLAYRQQGILYTTWWQKCGHGKTTVCTELTEDENKNAVTVLEADKSTTGIDDHNIMSLLYQSSVLLLSSSFAEVYQLKTRLSQLKEKIMELDIKNRLKDHLNTKKGATQPSAEEKDIKSIMEKEESESEMMLLQQERDSVLCRLENMPSYIKDYSVPNPTDSANVLLSLCCILNEDEKMNNFCHQIQSWCKENQIEQTSTYTEKLVQKSFSNIVDTTPIR